MKYLITSGIIIIATLTGVAFTHTHSSDNHVEEVITYFNKNAIDFYLSTNELSAAINLIDRNDKRTIAGAKKALINSRIQYKKISFFLDYFFPHTAWIYNAPPKYEVEEPYMEYEEPHGFQQIETLLFSKYAFTQKLELKEQATVINESAKDLRSLLFQFNCTDAQVLESIHIELIRIMTLYITGYDAPNLKSGISESLASISALHDILAQYKDDDKEKIQEIESAFGDAIGYIEKNRDFDSFDRLTFLSSYAIPLEHQLHSFIEQSGLKICTATNLDFNAKDLFEGEVISADKNADKELIALGKILFYEKKLSGNSTRSCASCHQPDKYYTDQLPKNISIDQHTALRRNTPTLLYASLQSAQFWDGRVKSLDDQIADVLTNPQEMNNSFSEIEKRLNNDKNYRNLFGKAFHLEVEDSISFKHVSSALVAFLKTLVPMNSDFDAYMRGKKDAMTLLQKKGFNLFMGKAQCGTCHFIPVFNGSTPPFFNKSEYEVLGVPASENFQTHVEDHDQGRFSFFPSPFYRSAFKTPTVRNVERTAPYMHNGSLSSISKVLEFYNKGGGVGLGMKITNQTLPEKPLGLTKEEMKEINLFLNALTDRLDGDNLRK